MGYNKNKFNISMYEASKEIYQKEKIYGFFKGYSYRCFLFTGCMFIIGNLEKKIR